MNTEYLTAEDVANRLHVTPGTIRRWVRQGRIPEIRISPKIRRFDPDAVDTALRRGPVAVKGGGA
ncbi:MAG TPA: helix-turn-helix domain-containing protein [Candidatus Brocadiia bacterium]|nr:helix-turn-helix domain-containing protein [Candidatus Brocadiia bacterium]